MATSDQQARVQNNGGLKKNLAPARHERDGAPQRLDTLFTR